MKVTFDTNVLVRAAIEDEPRQAEIAARMLRDAELIAVPTPCLCEFVWVLGRTYRLDRHFIASALRRLLESSTVVTNFESAEAGLAVYEQGGDFADGVLAFEGTKLGASAFASFDRDAVRILERQGFSAFVPIP